MLDLAPECATVLPLIIPASGVDNVCVQEDVVLERDVPILATKLYIPPVRPGLVPRPRLIERLDKGLEHKLTLISAPAGFGKTTLLGEWAAGIEPRTRVAWLSLDAGDNDPVRFMSYLVAALQTVEERIDVGPSPPLPAEQFLIGLVNQLSVIPTDLVLILDDYHFITNQSIHDAVAFVLEHVPGNTHLAIATRADPPLPVARLRGRGQLTEIRQADLRFTPDEAAHFLNACMGLKLTPDDVAVLASRTEGWIAGLYMAALSMRDRDDLTRFVAAFAGSNRYVLEYLLEEVLYRESAHVQAFLLQTCILDRLCDPLCDAVVGRPALADSLQPDPLVELSGQEVLAYLERTNLFVVPLDDHRDWYRYHRLFADLLRGRLRQSQPDLVPVLHHRASKWYEQHGLLAEAIDHALAAGDMDRAADLIERDAEATLMRGQVATFLRWVDALPDGLVSARPSLCAFHAWVLLLSGQPLQIIESRLHDADKGGGLVSGRVTGLRALIAAFQGRMPLAVELSRQALELLSDEDRFTRSFVTWVSSVSQLQSDDRTASERAMDNVFRMSQEDGNVMVAAMVACNQAELYMRQGLLHKAVATYQRAVELATDVQGERLPIAGQALIGLGALAREWNDLDGATRYLVDGIQLTEQWTETGALEAYLVLARVRQAQGDVSGAWEAIRTAQELAVRFDVTDLDDLVVRMVEAQLWIAQGHLDAARRWAEERDLYRYIGSPLGEKEGASPGDRLHKYELVVLARLLVAQGRFEEAQTLLGSLLPVVERRGRPGTAIEIHALEALAFQAQGQIDRAMAALERALILAEPGGYVRALVDEGEPMARLLRQAAARGIAPGHVHRLLSALGTATPEGEEARKRTPPVRDPSFRAAESTLVESLSKRELQVLWLLTTHLSSTEIAGELGISVHTVRYHVKNIYGKLGVHRRSDAVDRAKELELL